MEQNDLHANKQQFLNQDEQQSLDPYNINAHLESQKTNKDFRQKVLDVQKHPYWSIGKINSFFEGLPLEQSKSHGTGYVLSPQLICTCAHVVHNKGAGKTADKIQFEFEIGDGKKYKLHVQQIFLHPLYLNQKRLENDIALLKLEKNNIIKQKNCLLIKWDYTYKSYPLNLVNITGYPEDIHSAISKSRNKQSFEYEQYQDEQIIECQRKHFLYYKHTTSTGNSGGPALLKQYEQDKFSYKVIGLHQGDVPKYNYCILINSEDNFNFIYEKMFINQIIKPKEDNITEILKFKIKLQEKQLKSLQQQNQSLKLRIQQYQDKQKKLSQELKRCNQLTKNQTTLLSKTIIEYEKNLSKIMPFIEKILHINDEVNGKKKYNKLLIELEKFISIEALNQQYNQIDKSQLLIFSNLSDNLLDSLRKVSKNNNLYLIKVFKTLEQINKKYRQFDWNHFSGIGLIHYQIQINFEQFVRYNWRKLQSINLHHCQIDDTGWKTFVNHSHLFQSLQNIQIRGNYIVTVNEGDLQRFPKLKFIQFGQIIYPNPLSKDTIVKLKKFKKNHPDIEIEF